MTFLWQQLLWLLLAIPALIIIYLLAERRRQRYALRYSGLSLFKNAAGRAPGFRRHIPPLIFLIGVAAMIFALARPIAVVSLPMEEGTVILAFDVSGSMAADDLKPNRMEAAKAAARTFVEHQPVGVRIGIVSFSDNAFIVQSPTIDRDSISSAINRLTPQRGTAIGRGIITSVEAINEEANAEDALFQQRGGQFGSGPSPARTPTPSPTPKPLPKGVYAPAIIILLSDGESNSGPAPLDVVKQASDQGYRIYTIGLGTTAGTILHVQGLSVRVRLDEAVMKKIAESTDGTYYNAANEKELTAVYEKLSTHLVFRSEKTEMTFGFTALGALLLIISGFLSLNWFNRLP